jgi:hypothetical protein
VYAAAGTALPAAAERRMRAWLASQKAHSNGPAHRYALADYGLDSRVVEAAFAGYAAFNERSRQSRTAGPAS